MKDSLADRIPLPKHVSVCVRVCRSDLSMYMLMNETNRFDAIMNITELVRPCAKIGVIYRQGTE